MASGDGSCIFLVYPQCVVVWCCWVFMHVVTEARRICCCCCWQVRVVEGAYVQLEDAYCLRSVEEAMRIAEPIEVIIIPNATPCARCTPPPPRRNATQRNATRRDMT